MPHAANGARKNTGMKTRPIIQNKPKSTNVNIEIQPIKHMKQSAKGKEYKNLIDLMKDFLYIFLMVLFFSLFHKVLQKDKNGFL
jgi:hypothetical protein